MISEKKPRYKDLRILLIAEHASDKFGGEASIPLHIFRKLRARGVEVWMITHSRTRAELETSISGGFDRIYFVPDTWLNKLIARLGRFLPAQIAYFTLGYISRLSSQCNARNVARQLIAEKNITLVHQPIPVSPREPSILYNLGVPVIMGPLNGGMAYPPSFRSKDWSFALIGAITLIGRQASNALHLLMPGKLKAATLLVANERTRHALPPGYEGRVIALIENGVDLALWSAPARIKRLPCTDRPVQFIFIGRLIELKAVDLLLLALAKVIKVHRAELIVVGEGPMRASLEAEAQSLGLGNAVRFTGWLSQMEVSRMLVEADALVLPSLHEAGGAVILEAMASGLPVVATNWGGPADYLDDTCGFLIDPLTPEDFVEGLTKAMLILANCPEMRDRMGHAGAAKVSLSVLNWDHKVDRLLEIYRETTSLTSTTMS